MKEQLTELSHSGDAEKFLQGKLFLLFLALQFPKHSHFHRVSFILLENKAHSPSLPFLLPFFHLVTPRVEQPKSEIWNTCSCNDLKPSLHWNWKDASQFRQDVQCIVSKLVFSLKELQETSNLVNYSILLCKLRRDGLGYMVALRFCSNLSNGNQLVGIEVVNLSLDPSCPIKASKF